LSRAATFAQIIAVTERSGVGLQPGVRPLFIDPHPAHQKSPVPFIVIINTVTV
jgi:hypothetical protein